MLKIEEAAIWPPQPDQVTFDNSSWEIIGSPDGICTPNWAKVTELGGRVGTFLINNMDGEAAVGIVNELAGYLDEEQQESFMTGVRNSINIEFERREWYRSRASYDDGQLVMTPVMEATR